MKHTAMSLNKVQIPIQSETHDVSRIKGFIKRKEFIGKLFFL